MNSACHLMIGSSAAFAVVTKPAGLSLSRLLARWFEYWFQGRAASSRIGGSGQCTWLGWWWPPRFRDPGSMH